MTVFPSPAMRDPTTLSGQVCIEVSIKILWKHRDKNKKINDYPGSILFKASFICSSFSYFLSDNFNFVSMEGDAVVLLSGVCPLQFRWLQLPPGKTLGGRKKHYVEASFTRWRRIPKYFETDCQQMLSIFLNKKSLTSIMECRNSSSKVLITYGNFW